MAGKLSYDLSLLEEADQVNEEEDHVKYYFSSIKWHESYPLVTNIVSFLNSLESENYGFVRVGKELGDIETEGEYWEFGIEVATEIHF